MKRRKRNNKYIKHMMVSGACILLLGSTIGTTLAWLRDEREPVQTTFVAGEINLSVSETSTTEYSIIPGIIAGKDPVVTVLPNSESCYLFVRGIETNNDVDGLDGTIIEWEVLEGETEWSPLSGQDSVWYRMVTKEEAENGTTYQILKGNETYPNGYIYVNPDVLRTMTDGINQKKPTLEFIAAAVQSANIPTAAAAFAAIPDGFMNP